MRRAVNYEISSKKHIHLWSFWVKLPVSLKQLEQRYENASNNISDA